MSLFFLVLVLVVVVLPATPYACKFPNLSLKFSLVLLICECNWGQWEQWGFQLPWLIRTTAGKWAPAPSKVPTPRPSRRPQLILLHVHIPALFLSALQSLCSSTRHPSSHCRNIFSSSCLHGHHCQFLQCSDEHRNPSSPTACLAVFPVCQGVAAMQTVRWTQRFPLGLLHVFACPLGAIFLSPAAALESDSPGWLRQELWTLPQAQAGGWLCHCSSAAGDGAVPPWPEQSAADRDTWNSLQVKGHRNAQPSGTEERLSLFGWERGPS